MSSAASVVPLSSDTVTAGLEVSLFLSPSLLFSCYYESCSDALLRQLASADSARARRQAHALTALQHTQPEAAERIEEEERLIDDMIALADSTAEVHLPNRPSDQPPPYVSTPPSIAAMLYSSMQHKRIQVLRALHAATRADIEHFHSRQAAPHSAAPSSTAAANRRRAAAPSFSNTAVSPSQSPFSSVPPLLRWSLLSMFPLIDSVSRVDPGLRLHTVRLLVGVLHTSPPLSLFHEADSTIALIQSQLTGAAASSLSIVAGADMHNARIGLAIQRGQLRHILAAVQPLLTQPSEDGREDEAAQIDIQPYLATLAQYAASKPLLSALTEDTLISQWRHHPVGKQQVAEQRVAITAAESVHSLDASAASAGESASADSAAALMASYTTPLLGSASEREANNVAALELFSPPTAASLAPPAAPPTMTPSGARSSASQSSSAPNTASPAVAAGAVSPQSRAPSPSLPSYGCLASDGVYQYVHTQHGLHKFGSGFGGSLQGHLYGSQQQPFAALLPELPPSLSTVLSSDSCHHVYGGWLVHQNGSLLFRSSLFILAQPKLLAVRICAQTLSAVELVWADDDSYQRVRDDSSRGSVRWFHAMTDGEHLLLLREQHRDRHCFYLDRFSLATATAGPPSSAAGVASTVPSSYMTLLSSTLLPCGFTQFPSAHRYTRSLSSLLSPYQFHVGQRVDAKDSINKWCPAVIVELTASRALVHYDGWASRWDEWIALDSGRVVKRGEGADKEGGGLGKEGETSAKRKGKGNSSNVGGSTEADEAEWFYSVRRISTPNPSSTSPEDDWMPHSSLNSSKLEHAYLALSSAPLASSAAFSPSLPSVAALSLRSARQSFDADVSSMTQVDCHTGQLFYLKRRSVADSQSFSFLEDVHWAVTGSQLLCVLPASCPPNPARRPVLRLFDLSADESGDVRWLADVRLFAAQARSLPSSLSSAFTHVSHQLDAQLSTVCFDPANNELLSYHSGEQIVRRWRNAGPQCKHSASSPSEAAALTRARVETESTQTREQPLDASCGDVGVDHALPSIATHSVDPSPLSLSAELLARVSAFYQFCPSAASSASLAVQPFCVDVHASTFSHLHRLLEHCWRRLQSCDATTPLLLSCCTSLLRLLEANLLHLPTSTVESSSWQPVLASTSDLLIAVSASTSSAFSSLRVQSDDCLLAGFSSFFPSTSSLIPFLCGRLSVAASRQRLLDCLSSSDRLMILFPPGGSDQSLPSLLSACLVSCEEEARVALGSVSGDSPSHPSAEQSSAQSATPPLLLSSALQLALRLQRYLLCVTEQPSVERSSALADGSLSWTAVFRTYCQQLATLCASVLSSAADRIADSPNLATHVSSALIGQATGVLLPSLLAFLCTRPADTQALVGCFLPLLQQLDRLNRAVHTSPPVLFSTVCLSAATYLSPLPTQFPSTVVESPHPYSAGTIDRSVLLPSSLYVAVDFSALCCSRNGNDALKLSQPDGWSLVCSGGSAGGGLGKGWPRWMVRRQGGEMAVYWQVEASKADAKEQHKGHGNDWGWQITLLGFSPHPIPQVKRGGRESGLDVLFDLELSATTALSRSLRPSLASADTSTSDIAEEEWHKQVEATDHSPPADEEEVAAAVDLSLLSAGLAADEVEEHNTETAEQQLLRDELLLLGITSSPSLPARQPSSDNPSTQLPHIARLLLDALSSHVTGRPAMTLAMRRTILPVEAAILASLLVHTRLLPTAVALIRALRAEQQAASLSTTTPPHPSSVPVAASSLDPQPAVHQATPSRPQKRVLSDEQRSLVAALAPLVQSGVYRVVTWLLHRAQLERRWQHLVGDTAQHIRQYQQQLQRDEQSQADPTPAHGVTVQSLLLAAAASNRAPPSQLPSDLDPFIRDRLSAVSAGDLKQLAELNHVLWCDEAIDESVAQLARIARRSAMEAALVADTSVTAQSGSLERLAARACSMAAFLCAFQPRAAHAMTGSSTTELVSAVCAYHFAGCSSITPTALSAVLEARVARSNHRAVAYGTLAASLSCLRVTSCRDALLASLPPRLLLVDDIHGCSETALHKVHERYRECVQQLLDTIRQSATVDASAPPSTVSIDSLLQLAAALMASSSFAPLSVVTSVVDCLVSLHRVLSPYIALLVNPLLPPLSSTLLFSSSPSAPPLCSYVLTDSNHTDLAIYQCKTCGFTDGKVICGSCARSCHVGHDVSLLKQGTAFCDCWLFCGDKCAGMYWSKPARRRQQLQGQLDDCRMAATDLIIRAMEEDNNQVAAARLCLQRRLLHHIVAQAEGDNAGLDDDLLHSLLSCAYRVRRRLVFSDDCSLDATSSSAVSSPSLFSSPSAFGGVLLRLCSASSLRCQRLALRLLAFLLCRVEPDHVATSSFPASLPFSALSTIAVLDGSDGSTRLLTALLISVGDAVLHSSHSESSEANQAVEQPAGAGVHSDTGVAESEVHSSAAAGVSQLLLCRPPVLDMSTATESASPFPNASVSSFVSSFVDRCGVDVLHYQHIQALLDAASSAAGPLALSQPASSSDSGKVQLDSAYRRQLTKQLNDANEATVFEGQRHLCEELGGKLAAHGLLLRVEARSESAGKLRNVAAVAGSRGTQGWQRRRMTGRQSLCAASEMIVLIRTLLLAHDSSAKWQQLTERVVSSHLAYLGAGEYAPLRVDGLLSGWRVELLAAIGALAVATGSTGYELPTLGAAVRVTNRDNPLEELAAPPLQPTDGLSPPSPSRPDSVSSVTAALCGSFSRGRVVYVDEGGSETRVVRDGDARRAGERVHWTRVVAGLPAEVDEAALLSLERAPLRLSMVESAVGALTALSSAPPRDAPVVTRGVLAMLQSRLLRLVAILAADSHVAQYLLTNHSAVLDKVIVAALSPAVTVELRTVTMECSRAMEIYADLILNQQSALQRTDDTRDRRQATPAGWRRDNSALRCLFSDNDCTVLYSGRHSSNPVKRMKVTIDELFPTLLTATRQWELPHTKPTLHCSPDCYFEVSLLSDMQSLSIGVCPVALPCGTSPSSISNSAAPSSSLPASSLRPSVCSGAAHLFGWLEGSVVYCNDGSKARFWHAVKSCSTSPLHVHDLVDVRDSAAGKWQQAIVAAETDDTLTVHYLQWDSKYDEVLARNSDRLDTFLTRTRYTNRTAAEQRAVTGQLWREPYSQSFHKGDVVGCGYSERAGGVFFTLNGRYLGVAYRQNIASRLLPAVCLHDCNTKIAANFDGPFVYKAGSESMSREADDKTEVSAADGGESMWAEGGGSDISSSLRQFNDPSHTATATIAQRLTAYTALPTAAVYRRHELADEMRRSGLFPDLTVAQLLLALEMSDDDQQRAMELAYCQSSLLSQAAAENEQTKNGAGSGTPVAPLFSPAARTMFPTSSSAASSSSSFFSGPFNSSSPVSRGPRMSSIPMPRRPGLISASSAFSSVPAASSSSSSSSHMDEDGFDDLLFDDDSVRTGGSGGSPPPLHSAQHAYALDTLSGAARSVNHFYASEWNELQFLAHRDRTNRAADGGESSGERLLPFDIPPQSALDVLQLLESFRRPSQDAAGVLDVLQQLRQLSSSSEALLFLSGGRPANPSDSGSGLFVSGSPSSAPPAAINRAECVVGASVRISANAKSVCIGSLPSTGHGAVLWCDEMSDLIGRVGQITAVDWRVELVRVQCVDHERGTAKELWWPPAALSRLITLRRRGYVAGNHPLVILSHLLHLHNKLVRHMARQLLIALMPHIAQLTARLAEEQDREMVRLKAAITNQPAADDEDDSNGATDSLTTLYHKVPLVARETLMVWSLRSLHPFLSVDGSSIVQPPLPYTKPAIRWIADQQGAVRLLAYLSSQHPQLGAQCLRHTQHMIAQSADIEYYGSQPPRRHPASAPSLASPLLSTGATLMYRTVHVPYACCLVVTFVNVSVASGALLSFYGSAHYQRLLLQIRGQRGGRTPIPQSPFVVPSNTVWIALTADSPTGVNAADSSSSVRLLVTPVSEQLSAGLWLAQHALNGRQQSAHFRQLFDVCMELLVLPVHVPAFVRVPVLRLAIAVIRSSPRGSLGDFQPALPLFREMLNMRSESEREQQMAEGRRANTARREGPQLCSPLMQLLFELHAVIVAHFCSPPPAPSPSAVAVKAVSPRSARQLRRVSGESDDEREGGRGAQTEERRGAAG